MIRKKGEIQGAKGALKVYKMIYDADKVAVVLQFPIAFIQAVQPYLALFVTGYILNGLVAAAPFADMLRFALIFIGVRFGLTLLEQYLHKIQQAHNEIAVSRLYLMYNKKYMDVDFELLDSPAINKIQERINRDNSWGAGFYNTSYYLRIFLISVFGLITGAAVMVPFFRASGVGGVMLLLGGLFLFGILSALLNSKFFQQKIQQLLASGSLFSAKRTQFFIWNQRGNAGTSLAKASRIYKAIPLLASYFDEEAPNTIRFGKKFTKYQIGAAGLQSLSAGVFSIGAFLFVTARAVAGVIPVGDVVFFAGSINEIAQRFFNLTTGCTQLIAQCDRIQSMLEFMELENKQYKGTLPVEKRRDGEYEIIFKDVSFKYPGSETYALRNFNLNLRIGQKLAIVGMNGSGKTTMIKLLTRLYDPTGGVITLNGIDIKKYDYKEYMRIFSVVFQDFKIFSFTLAENIACGTDYDPDAAKLAIDRVGLTDWVNKMPAGMDSYLYNDYDNGIEISGGEGQKVALARALYKNAPIIVLDEPTAALDPIAEFEVYSMFNEVIQARAENTAIFISHRLSSCRFCDDIAVFHEGELIQRGDHDTLLSNERGQYYKLWNAQAQYYKEETE